MNRHHLAHSLDLNDDRFLHEKIQPVAAIQSDLSIDNRQWLLLLHLPAALRQL